MDYRSIIICLRVLPITKLFGINAAKANGTVYTLLLFLNPFTVCFTTFTTLPNVRVIKIKPARDKTGFIFTNLNLTNLLELL